MKRDSDKVRSSGNLSIIARVDPILLLGWTTRISSRLKRTSGAGNETSRGVHDILKADPNAHDRAAVVLSIDSEILSEGVLHFCGGAYRERQPDNSSIWDLQALS